MEVQRFDIEGPMLIRGTRFHDERGYFSETYNERAFADLGLPKFVQDNLSSSKKGVFRGLHWQTAPHAQGKLVTCISGSIIDYILDIRRSSPTFGEHLAIPISGERLESVWVPEGFAHGFLAISDQTRVHYKVNKFWDASSERSVHVDVLAIGQTWAADLTLSEKDAYAPSLDVIFLERPEDLFD
jgi:dTDP-4-dehydrorhamnose 3,5-epimerase